MTVYLGSTKEGSLYYNNKEIMVAYYNNEKVFDKHIIQDWVGTASGTDIWGKPNSIGGYTGTQSSSFTFSNPQRKGKWKLKFDWSGQAYVTAYYCTFTVTYDDNTTEVIASGCPEFYSGGSGTSTRTVTINKPWKSISVSHSRSIITTIYCYSYLGNVQMEFYGSDQI